MDPCFSSVKTSSVSSALTVAHLIRNIEQLKNKDKLISQLEKDLGRQSWGAATHFAVLERRRSEGNPLPPGGLDLSQPFQTLPEGGDDPDTFLWTPTSIQTPGDVEDVWTNTLEGNSLGKRDLSNQLKGNKDRYKDLVEKCRSFLQRNKELTAQNRAFKESNDRATQDTKKSQELLEHSKLQMLQLSRQLSHLKTERSEWEQQMRGVEGLQQELMEDKKMINALRKACSDKDRRIELIQHRKKRRRMIETAEKVKIQNAGLKETPFGYEEDDKQHGDGNQSVCSLSSTISDDSVWDEVLSKEEMERNYQRLMLEQLELQKSHAMLQRQTANLQDPQRENQSKEDLQNDLFLSQCRVEQLEYYIREGLQGKSEDMAEEREIMQAKNDNLYAKVKDLEMGNRRLQKELADVQERNEDMEFRLIELEQYGENSDAKEVPPCPDATSNRATPTPDQSPEVSSTPAQIVEQTNAEEKSQEMEQLAREMNALLKGKGRDAEAALKKMDSLMDREKALEGMAHELQMKVISLQQEKNSLQDRLLLVEQSKPGKGGNSVSLTEAKERQENLALKATIESQSQLVSERANLQGQLEDLKAQNDVLKLRVGLLTQQQKQQDHIKEELIQPCVQSNLQSPVPNAHSKGNSSASVSPLSRKSSDRKSKSRDGEDRTTSKRRKSESDESDDHIEPPSRKYNKTVGHTNPVNDPRMAQNITGCKETGTNTSNQEEKDFIIQNKMTCLENELTNMKKCNDELIIQLQESVAKKLEVECSHQSLQDQLSTMEQDLDLLHQENVALGDQLRQRVEEFQLSQDERNPRESELEEFCEDLQERLRDAENCERQLREKLKLFEKSIEEAESHEMAMRERCEQLLAGDYEAKKQIQDLYRTGIELRDILLEKEIVEQALRDKVDFLQKAEAASVERIDELEAIVEDLRQQLDDKSDGNSQYQKETHKITEMKHQMTFLETDNKALSARVAELEENEEILRENWRRVADEDFNRTQCLEEKVKMLESMNRDLKVKLKDAQEYLVIDMSESNLSLAAELAESESKILDDSSDDNNDGDDDMGVGDEVYSPAAKHIGVESSGKKVMGEKVRKLERQLSELAEQKNTKIESLQEQLVGLKETEIKLSETISEMEMTEREHRAKLALYESSEITVEKMLKYQSKIEELRTSQESLLDQLEIKENQEMTLQEKMQEMERTLRGTIVTLEVEMKGFKQRELKNAGQIREFEKQEIELSEKVSQQAEKENGLYVKISSLMDELKTCKTDLENVRQQMEDKEDKVRQTKLLEVKLLEIEMECGKKVSTLNAKLRHREEEFRQKESAYEEQISTLRESHHNRSTFEDEFAQKEQEMQQMKSEKDEEISNLSLEISELQTNSTETSLKVCSLEKELESEREKVCEKESLIQSLNEEIESKVKHFESAMIEKESEHKREKQTLESEIHLKEKHVSELVEELKEALQQVSQAESEEMSVQEAAQVKMLELKNVCDSSLSEVEKKVTLKLSSLESRLKTMQSYISDLQDYISEKCIKICELEAEKEEQRKEFEKNMLKLENEKDVIENELKNKVCHLNSQLEEQLSKSESEQSVLLKDSQEREASLSFDVSNLQHQVEQHKHELIAKLSELEAKNKAHCELSLELSSIRHDHKILQKELDKSKQSHTDLKLSLNTIISQKDSQLNQSSDDIAQLNKDIEELKQELCEKDHVIDQISDDKDTLTRQRKEELQKLMEEKSHFEIQFTEKCQEIDTVNKLHLEAQREFVQTRKMLDDKDHVIQKHEQEKGEKETLLKETQSHVQSVQVDKETLAQELQSVKSHLEEAQSQITLQQQELQLLGNQLQSHQEEINKYKIGIKEKEESLQEKDQMYNQIATELKNLHQDIQDRDHKLEQAECKVADVELKLKRAENRVRELESMHVSLEVRLEERYAVSQDAEKVLRSKEVQCKEMENKLSVAEKNLANLKDQMSVGDESSKELSQRLQDKDIELEGKQSEMLVLKETLEEREEICLSLESKFEQLEMDFNSMETKYNEEKQRLEILISDKEILISSVETKLQQSDSNVTELTSKCDNLLSKLDQVSKELDQKSLDFNDIQSQTQGRDVELSQCEAKLEKSEQELANLNLKLEESENIKANKIIELENIHEENQSLKQTIDKLSTEKESYQVREENLHHEMQRSEEKNKILISDLESEKSDLISTFELLQTENASLKDRIQGMERELSTINEQSSELTEGKQTLSSQLSEVQSENKSLLVRISALESDLSISANERDRVVEEARSLEAEKVRLEMENIHFQREIEEAAKEFQNITVSFEESKTNIENQVGEISKGKQKVEEDFAALQREHSRQASDMTRKLEGRDKEIGSLKQKSEHLMQENSVLISYVDSLKLELTQAQDTKKPAAVENIEDQMVSETDIKVSMAPSLFSTPSSRGMEIPAQENQQQLIKLETSLNEVKDKEKHLHKRVSELETVEKELREQIVDIEMTVIVPLETENQDLKDEIGIVKQERDEAISKISKWDDDDDDDEGRVQESETVHQRLEDALIFGEELEKKNSILLNDIQILENQNESLHEKISDLEATESERKDEIDNLQEEIKSLSHGHQDTSVLEETETTLMDRVLDLEERERNLIQELEKMKISVTNAGKDWTEIDSVSEKMKYLEQKNQILQDAEGRYMDKIMELEEDKHRLLSELSSSSNNVDMQISQSHNIPHTSVNIISVSISTQTCVPFEISDTVNSANSSDSVDLSNHSQTATSSGQTHPSSEDNENIKTISVLEDQLQESKVKLEELDAQLREKETSVLYLQDKLELLKDSEGKLMDKLLEAEEKASSASTALSHHASEISELNKKIDHIQEENEFLAENVEQYKKSFKEEKEKCNDLQDRLMEDSVNVSELQKTQEELVKTQQMVEDIQSEYEEQLSERLEQENNLKEELSLALKKQSGLEEVVSLKTKREEELLEQVDGLRSAEKELVSRMALMKTEDEDSALSDSGLSADDPRIRNDHIGLKETGVVEAPIVHRSVKTVLLASPFTSNSQSLNEEKSEPSPHPRSVRKLRPQSIDNISHEELVFLVEDLQDREAALKKRVSDLQAIEDSDLSQKVVELESEKVQLERRLRYTEQQNALSQSLSSDSNKLSSGDTKNNNNNDDDDLGIFGRNELDQSSSTSTAMLEKPEDVLNQRIKELEGLDKHNKNMVSELERDREVLHEIARKDKATIHDLNVKIRELQLSERSLKEQVTNLEVSENSFFNKCEDLEATRVQLEDRVHELEIHERRLRELVRKLKLDEERWLSKSDGMENAFAELSANETQLKRIVQDMEMEKGGLSERAGYLESRVRELESVELTLLARIKEYENNEVILQNRLVQLENAEAAAHSRASELDMVNANLGQQHKKMVDENAIMAQHLAQLHGQVQDLDRRLLSSRDSEIAYKQHVESLQKNESLLQKKVREYELREIDSQSAIRELDQTIEINNDKLSALQRSENRLRYRVQELEGVGGQIPGELTPSNQQKVPQKIEDCQKRIVVLQEQVENLKLQLRQALNTAQQQSANKSDNDDNESKSNSVSISTDEYSQLHAKAALLDEYAYQNEELESNQEQLRDTILQLRQGKGACGHEVEIEVYKRRIESLQTFISKLKSSLSEGQTTSLLDSDQDSGPQGETLPARHLQVLESERVLQSVRGLHHDGKADTPTTHNGGVNSTGLAPIEDSMIQAEAAQNMASLPSSTTPEDSKDVQMPEQPSRLEESHWKAIEARKPVTNSAANDSRGGVTTAHGRDTKSSPRHHGKQQSSTMELEDVTGVLNLQSESELSSYHRTTQNDDTDSCSSPIPPPRKNRANRLSKNLSDDNSSSNNGSGSDRDHRRHSSAHKATANQKHFGNGESLPLTASNIERQFSSQQQKPAPLSRFAEDSFYLPSSTQEGVDSLDDDDESPPPLPSQGPPGQDMSMLSGRSSRASSTNIQEGRKESLDNSTSGLSIRERIALIERHLQSDTHTGSQSNREEEDQLFYWKRKSMESLRQAETLDKNNKFLKEDINRLEKELEEKRRHINTLELWLSSTEDLLKNKSKQTDREMIEQLQLDLTKLRKEMVQSGYHSEDALLDAAALKTELEHKDKEITSKRFEIESLAQELRRCHKECRSIEGMRRTALDSLRSLEREVLHLQDVEEKLKKSQTEINSLKVQYDELDQFKNQALALVQPLQMKVDKLTKKCREKDVLLQRLGAELRRGVHRPSSALDELTRLERAMNGEDYSTDNSDNLSDDLSPRPTNHTIRGRSVSMDELSLYSDTDSLHGPSGPNHPPSKRQRPTPYVNSRPRSAEAGNSNLRSPRRFQDIPQTRQSGQRPLGHLPSRGFDLAHKHFVAIADYDPGLYSQSGRPRLELALREGDQVRVSGPMDRLGYCEAECNGHAGLVPANYLQPVHYTDMNGHSPPSGVGHHQKSPVIHLDHGVEPPAEFQDNSLQYSSPNRTMPRMKPARRSRQGGGMHPVPDPPHNLHVRGIQDGCLVLAWKPPQMDAKGCSKGFQVMGYMVYVNNEEYEQIPNPQICQVAIERFDPSSPHHFAVQSLCAGGHASPRTELMFEGMVRLGELPDEEEEDTYERPLDTDLSSVLNSIHYTKGMKKKVMALYEYNPEHQSPHDYTAFELAFHAGDVLAVYGDPRPDGFYHGEMEGRRGLVPACFVEDLALSLRRGKQGSEDSGHESSKA